MAARPAQVAGAHSRHCLIVGIAPDAIAPPGPGYLETIAVETTHQRLSRDDTRILRLESPAIFGHTLKLLTLTGEPIGVDELRAHVDGRLGDSSIARKRLDHPKVRLGTPAWIDDPGFEISDHVRDHSQSGPLEPDELTAVVGELMSERLDHTRPLWRLDLIGPLAGGGCAIAMFIHHCMADGITALRFAEEMLWDVEAGAPQPGATPQQPGTGAPATSGLRSAVSALRRLPGTLLRELRPGDRGALDRHIGPRRELAFVDRPLGSYREIAHRASDRLGVHVTVNDVVLAAIAGGLRAWSGGRASERLLRAQIPVSLHSRDENPDQLGNHDSFLFVDLPTMEPDPLRRLEQISAETVERKQLGDADELYAFFHALGRLGPLGRPLERLSAGPREFSLSISNVPGPRGPISVLERPVTSLRSSSEPSERHALRVSAISGAGILALTLCSDPDAISALPQLAESTARELDELGGLLN